MADPTQAHSIQQVRYVPAITISGLLAVILIGMILYLRPSYDPIVIVTAVGGLFAVLGAQIISIMKAEETRHTVNSKFDEWKKDNTRLVQAETIVAERSAVPTRQTRKADELPAVVLPSAVVPVPVVVVADPDSPIPVVVKDAPESARK